MTTPEERTRSLVQTGAFLKEMESDAGFSESARYEARRLLRHFPTVGVINLLAKIEQKYMGPNLLTPQIDSSWLRGYRLVRPGRESGDV